LARPEGNPPGGRGLALFLVETRDREGRLQGIAVERLKDKLGTRKVPTAELTLEGTPATLVKDTIDGVRDIAPMLNVTRLWNGVSAAALMRRGLALARDYARRRLAFGAPLSEKPLHADTLANLQAEAEAAFHLAFRVAELVGLGESGEAGDEQLALLRLLTPLMKLTTARQAVAVTSEVLEAFGGAGYVEDTGLPVLLRDAQVLSIWEGTTNVLALDALRALGRRGEHLRVLKSEVRGLAEEVREPKLVGAVRAALGAVEHAEEWFTATTREGGEALEAGARRFALTLGRGYALALLARHAQWSLEHERDGRPAAAARRFALSGVNLVADFDADDARELMNDR
ncbi:MAG TPA: acyl-CoA dehydrogenase family protein, partial [Pyrinomonadaceae bacterium]|nr:acyl-CoA dehydrogenase family protein [Pyrinomonadaceae bacterium]